MGQVYAWIDTVQSRIVQRGNLPQEDTGESRWSEFQLAADPGDVVSRNHSPKHGGNVHDLDFGLSQLFVGHRTIAGAEINGARDHLAESATAADRLIVKLNVRVQFVVLTKPFGVHGVGKCSSRPV